MKTKIRSLVLSPFLIFVLFLNPTISNAQIYESFSDGNFTENPTWTGTVDQFQVTTPHNSGDGSLSASTDGMVLGSLPKMSNSALFLESSRAYGEWTFSAAEGHGWAISSTNCYSIILLSDTNDPQLHTGSTPNFNGYFLRFDGSSDNFVLYRQQGTTPTMLIDTNFPDGEDGTTSIPRSFKITRSETGEWAIFIDNEWDITAVTPRGNAVDNEITTSQYFGIVTKVGTPSDSRVLWFDNLYIGEEIVDTTPPTVLSANTTSDKTAVVTFSEPLSSTSALLNSNYNLEDQGEPLSVTFTNSEQNQVLLTFQNSFPLSTSITLSISNVSDINNNVMLPYETTLFYAPPQPGDIVINEIYFDQTPTIGLPNGDFLELYNRRDYNISIKDWVLSIGTKDITLPNFTLNANQFLIIAPSSVYDDYSNYGDVLALISTTDLTNTGKTITLRDTADQTIHTISYDISFYQDPDKIEGGWSIEQIDPNGWCQQKTNWRASIAEIGGTPGSINSVNAENIDNTPPTVKNVNIINPTSIEINFSEQITNASFDISNYIINPSISITSSQSNDQGDGVTLSLATDIILGTEYTIKISNIEDLCGNTIAEPIICPFIIKQIEQGDVIINEIFFDQTPPVGLPDYDFLELYNRRNHPISIKDWVLSIGTKNITIPTFTMEAHQYLIIAPSASYEAYSQYGTVLTLISTTDLTATGKEVTLRDTSGMIIHTVSYNTSFYKDPDKEEGGWSIELIDPDGWCQQRSNWRASIAEIGGTPGSVNSVSAPNIDDTPPEIEAIWTENIQKIHILFNEEITTQSATTLANYSFDGGIAIGFIRFDSISKREVTIMLNTPLEEDTEYQLTVSNISDFCGNILLSTTRTVLYLQPAFGMIVFNEIMCNPKEDADLPNVKYIELYNRSQNEINLYQWELRSGTTTYKIPAVTIERGAYVILKQAGSTLIQEIVPEVALFSSTFLSVTSKTLELYAQNNTLIHWVSYSNSWYNDEYKKLGGYSLEQIDPNNFCLGAGNWTASNDRKGGTPGTVNSVAKQNPDNTEPELLYLTVDSDTSVTLHFNEPLNFAELMDNTKWNISPGTFPNSIVTNSPKGTLFTLLFNTPLEKETTYTITAPTIRDCAGNEQTIEPKTFQLPESLIDDHIIINEILFDPFTKGTEFVELYNNSTQIYALNNIFLTKYNSDNSIATLAKASEYGHLIYPNDYIVLAKTRKQIADFYPLTDSLKVVETQSLPSLPSSGGNIVLMNTQGKIIDKLTYDKKMHSPLLRNTKGVSLERINPNIGSEINNNWHSAAQTDNFATPTYINSQNGVSPISDSKYTLSSKIFSPDGDGYDDYLLIGYNFNSEGISLNTTIFDVHGRVVKKLTRNYLAGQSGELRWDGTNEDNQRVPVGPYVIYLESLNHEGKVEHNKLVVTVAYR
ncbi:MAG: lamin tail domain-containing protein [Salinivirgaceae bacterium]|nr:lamin tail domain-containing protein [Salinivirgaceae bacterium]